MDRQNQILQFKFSEQPVHILIVSIKSLRSALLNHQVITTSRQWSATRLELEKHFQFDWDACCGFFRLIYVRMWKSEPKLERVLHFAWAAKTYQNWGP